LFHLIGVENQVASISLAIVIRGRQEDHLFAGGTQAQAMLDDPTAGKPAAHVDRNANPTSRSTS
jgi:hypothetical protein